jgi:MerR family transcriptional regulator, heat shock protein HspR
MNTKKNKKQFPREKSDMPLYTIGVVSELLGTTNQTLRLYEKHGLIKPYRKNANRFYSENDIQWLFCLRELIHNKKISIEGIKMLLNYAHCWQIKNCDEKTKNICLAFKNRAKPCWELNKEFCTHSSGRGCEDCVIYLQKTKDLRKQDDAFSDDLQ